MTQKPVMLLILDGWGYREKITPDNAIENGNTPKMRTKQHTMYTKTAAKRAAPISTCIFLYLYGISMSCG